MAGKEKTIFICNECGYESSKWYGQCPSCKEWNCMEKQEVFVNSAKNVTTKNNTVVLSHKLNDIQTDDEVRYVTRLTELDRVLGGGIVKGSVVLISGDPGIGKSTIMLQICQCLSNLNILYVSGEESLRQIKLRAVRLGVDCENLSVMSNTNVEGIISDVEQRRPDLVIIDSIQTMNLSQLSSSPGSVTQIRESANLFMQCAKSLDIPIFIVGHVNKDGAIAGPKVLEHIVDAVLYFEGDRNMPYRILRAVKNRYGSTNEIGIYEMSDKGLVEVENPSLMLLSGRPKNVSGTCVACIMEGTRPIMAEVQGLVTTTPFGNPRRMATGFDFNRMNLLLAVLEKRCGYFFSNLDVYVNVIGGLKLYEPAADLTVALSLVSSLKDIPVDDNTIAFGEVGLAGEIRSVSHAEARVKEAARLGFKRCVIPVHNYKQVEHLKDSIEIIGVRTIKGAFEALV